MCCNKEHQHPEYITKAELDQALQSIATPENTPQVGDFYTQPEVDALLAGLPSAHTPRVNFLGYNNQPYPVNPGQWENQRTVALTQDNHGGLGSGVVTLTGLYLIPASGLWLFQASAYIYNFTTPTSFAAVRFISSLGVRSHNYLEPVTGRVSFNPHISVIAHFNAGMSIVPQILVSGAAGTGATVYGDASGSYTSFSGALIRADSPND